MAEIQFLPNTYRSLEVIPIYSEIKAGTSAQNFLTILGNFEVRDVLLWDDDRLVAQMQSHSFTEFGIGYGDILLIHPDYEVKSTDLVLVRENGKFQIHFGELWSKSRKGFVGKITRTIKFFRVPLNLKSSLRKFPQDVIISNEQMKIHKLTGCVLGNIKDTLVIQVSGNSMIGGGILENDLIVVNRKLPYYNGDVVAVKSKHGYILKGLERRQTGFSFIESQLLSKNADYKPIPVNLDDTQGQQTAEIVGVVTALIRMYTPIR